MLLREVPLVEIQTKTFVSLRNWKSVRSLEFENYKWITPLWTYEHVHSLNIRNISRKRKNALIKINSYKVPSKSNKSSWLKWLCLRMISVTKGYILFLIAPNDAYYVKNSVAAAPPPCLLVHLSIIKKKNWSWIIANAENLRHQRLACSDVSNLKERCLKVQLLCSFIKAEIQISFSKSHKG